MIKKYIHTPTQTLHNGSSISKVFKDAVLRLLFWQFKTGAFIHDGVFMCAHVWRCYNSPAFSVDEHPQGTTIIDGAETF